MVYMQYITSNVIIMANGNYRDQYRIFIVYPNILIYLMKLVLENNIVGISRSLIHEYTYKLLLNGKYIASDYNYLFQ